MIDFASIRTHRGSQGNAFEEFVVQLARRHPPEGAKEFRRIEGAGGDRGVEALWILKDGREVGIQAKYFLRARSIAWAQIDKSVKTTLEKRPNVTVYLIALACDLTDKGGAQGRGRTGWAAWEAHADRWQRQAKAQGRSVTFRAVTASELVDWLAQPSAVGLARYWFGTDVLSLGWFAEQVRVGSADLGERYTPEQHVVVSTSFAFDGLARSPTLKARLHEALRATMKHSVVARHAGFSEAVQTASTKAAETLARVRSVETELPADPSAPWNVEQWLADLGLAQGALEELEQRLREDVAPRQAEENDAGKRPSRDERDYFLYNVHQAEYALRELQGVLRTPALRCDASGVLLLTGGAGTGKSHLLAAEANRFVAEQLPALLFLGQQFLLGNPWDQCARSLGLPTWP